MMPESTTPLKFLEAIGDQTHAAIVIAARTDVAVAVLLNKLIAADRVLRDDPRLRAGLNMLKSKGLMTEQQITEILGAS